MLFQNAYAALHPVRRIGDQLIDTVRLHQQVSRYDADKIARTLLSEIGFADPVGLMRRFSYETSAGDAQRAMLALALAGEPDLLIADEPTSLLDAIAQDEILTQLKNIQLRTGMAIWLITHDFGVVSRLADRVVVMYAGRAVETGPASQLLRNPRHPYSQGLIASVPSDGGRGPLRQIAGEIPDLTALPSGCSFRPRCVNAQDRCRIHVPDTFAISSSQSARCWLYAEA